MSLVTGHTLDDHGSDHEKHQLLDSKNSQVDLPAGGIESDLKFRSRATPEDLAAWSAEFPWIDQLIENLVQSGGITVRHYEDYHTLKPFFEASELRLLAQDTGSLQRSIFYFLLCIDRVLGEEEEKVITEEERRKIAYVRSRDLAAACQRHWKTPGYEETGTYFCT
jgi:hypothetical protein